MHALGKGYRPGRNALDHRIFDSRLREYVKASRRSIPEGLNKAGRNAAYRAIRLTPKTKLAQITADVGTPAHPLPVAYAIYRKNHPGAGIVGLSAKVKRMIAVKRSSIAYIAAGFLKAVKAFVPTSSKDVNPRSLAARGRGVKATNQRHYSEILNTAPGADEIAAGPLAAAALVALDDMMAHLGRTNRSAAKKFNR